MKFFLNTKKYWSSPDFCLSVLRSGAAFLFVLFLNYYAVRWATQLAGEPIDDLFFTLLPLRDTSLLDYYLALYVQYVATIWAFIESRRLPFFLWSLAALILTRAWFINLTHLGLPEGGVPTLSFFTQGGDLFFSGHVALPYLTALVYWEYRPVRYIFLGLAILMGIEVLIGRQHYSIDVFAAPFITYGVYCLVQKFFSFNKQSVMTETVGE